VLSGVKLAYLPNNYCLVGLNLHICRIITYMSAGGLLDCLVESFTYVCMRHSLTCHEQHPSAQLHVCRSCCARSQAAAPVNLERNTPPLSTPLYLLNSLGAVTVGAADLNLLLLHTNKPLLPCPHQIMHCHQQPYLVVQPQPSQHTLASSCQHFSCSAMQHQMPIRTA
jgi:hypothetical protein